MHTSTALSVLLGLAAAGTATAQTARPDIVWARDVQGATMTIDGQLNEPAWQQAERFSLVWNQNAGVPGSGQKIETGSLVDAPDPTSATVRVLRSGNMVYIAAEVMDKSIGGGRGLNGGNWNFDGLIMNLAQRGTPSPTDPNFFGGGFPEFFYAWWHPSDTTATGGQKVNNRPRSFGRFGCDWEEDPASGPCTVRADLTKWNYATTWQGTTNDDTHGDDTSYIMEMMVDAGSLGYDFTKLGGDRTPWNLAVQDADYFWGTNPANAFATRVWLQNQWGNNFIHGASFIAGSPAVTVSSGALPATGADLTIAGTANAPTIDGRLNESLWGRVQPALSLKYKDAMLANAPFGYDFTRYYRPDINGDGNTATIVDASTASFKMAYRGDMLYVGIDVDDQAISGAYQNGDQRDGARLSFYTRKPDSLGGWLTRTAFDFFLDSTGAVQIGGAAAGIVAADPTAITARAFLKGSSTAGNPADVDEGYQIEVAIDLVKALKYPAGRGDGLLWPAFMFSDADLLQDAGASYATRTWFMREGSDGPGLWSYMDPSMTVAADGRETVAGVLTLGVPQPSPTRGATLLRYALAEPGTVSIDVIDLLGRRVMALAQGLQAAGAQEIGLDAGALSAGVYVVRVTVDGAAGRTSATRPLVVAR